MIEARPVCQRSERQSRRVSSAAFYLRQLGNQLSLNRWEIYKSLFESRDGAQKIVPARDQRPGEDRIVDPGAVEYAGLFLFSGDVAIEDLDDAIDIGNQ